MKVIRLAVWIVAATLVPGYGFACSLRQGYLQPSNYDLVKQAEVIVVAQAMSYRDPDIRKREFNGEYSFRVLQTLKGSVGRTELALRAPNFYFGRSPENDFSTARPGAFGGACIANDYQVGKTFVLFLANGDSGWMVSLEPFSRVSEEVDSANSPWVSAVRHYARIGTLANYEAEKKELRSLQETARKNSGNPLYPGALIEDIERHFQTASPTRPYADLIALYNVSSMSVREKVVWALAKGKHPETAAFMRGLLRSGQFTNHIAPVSAYVEAAADSTSVPELGAAYLRADNRQDRWPIVDALVKVARDEHMPIMLAAFRSADIEDAARLAPWFVEHPDEEATGIIEKLIAGQYAERWQLTFSLAALGDAQVLEWARKTIQNPGKTQWMGYYVIGYSPLKDADDLARSIIRKGDPEGCNYLVEAYGSEGTARNLNPNRWDRLRDIVNLPNKSKSLASRIKSTLQQMADKGEEKAKALLGQLK